jgi:hypothetical protein
MRRLALLAPRSGRTIRPVAFNNITSFTSRRAQHAQATRFVPSFSSADERPHDKTSILAGK